ncbi:CDP-diacylglycerol--serine O-phosphatidyltransferase [bacterium]|nr:CDP-diacylglycerol--serine O-phosphatidyltransferase [bacterium]
MASREKWEVAAISILVAAFTDGLDGRMARLTKTQSEFGEQYDSMSDLVSFGAAPAFLVFQWALIPYGRLGWLACFLFLTCVAMRLARFNVQKQNEEKRYFLGCPSPVAASCVAAAVLFYHEFQLSASRDVFVLNIMIILALTMISSIRYRSFKDLNFKSQRGFGYALIIVVILLLVSRKPETYLFPIGMYYVLSAPVIALLIKLGLWRSNVETEVEEDSSEDRFVDL